MEAYEYGAIESSHCALSREMMHGTGERMVSKMLKGALAGALFLMQVNSALALSRAQWQQTSQNFKEGYLFAIMEHIAAFADGDDARSLRRVDAYKNCLRETRSDLAVRLLDDYFTRNPASFTQPVLISARTMFWEICAIKNVN